MRDEDFMNYVDDSDSDGCWLWLRGRFPQGYGGIWLEGAKQVQYAHRVSYSLFVGEIPDGLDVLHTCDNEPCVRPSHLYLGTDQNNADDRVARNRTARQCGELNGNCRITAEDAQNIRRSKLRQRELAVMYGLSQQHISDIKCGKRWRHL